MTSDNQPTNGYLWDRRSWSWTHPDGSPVDPTAQTEPLTKGQQIVADYENSMITQPCELAEAIDRAIWEAANGKQ